ncbi:MAG: hypothetical protein LJE64_14900, partial [Desulfofustis sp.]|nr:hypothetical protein [Desulfofustis sp.]
RAFIGESVSCLYQPLYVENGVIHDGVLDREIGSLDAVGPLLHDPELLMGFDRSWQPGYLAMVCPRCGDAMQGEPDSLVVHCFNCDSCWKESQGSFREVGYRAVDGGTRSVHLPFWRLRVAAEGIGMKSFGDLLTVANQPVVVRSEHRDRELEFWVPALKIRPKVFLTLARSATLSQLRFPEGDRELPTNLQPVTLPEREAFQAIKPLFADLAVNKRDVMPMLPDLSFTLQESTLTFLPFTDTGHDYVQTHSGLSVASSVVRFGRKL